jgi:adenylate cyclase
MTCNWYGDNDQSVFAARRAVELNPGNAHAHEILGVALTLGGHPLDGISSQQTAIVLSPRDPRHGVWMWSTGLSYFTARKYDDAVSWSQRAIQRRPRNPDAYLVLAASLGHLGRIEDGKRALVSYEQLAPRHSQPISLVWPYKNDTDNEHFRAGIRKASGEVSGARNVS